MSDAPEEGKTEDVIPMPMADKTPPMDDRMLPPEFRNPDFIQLRIAYNPNTGSCMMLGPLDNKGICYGALECARDVVVKYQEQMRRSKLMAPPPGFNGKGPRPS